MMAVIAAAAAGCSGGPEAQASTPSLMWQGARTVAVQCQVSSARGNLPELASQLCERIRELAAEGAAIPIVAAETPSVQPGVVTLLVQGSVHPVSSVSRDAAGEFLVFSVRPYTASSEGAAFYGTAPNVIPLSNSRFQGAAVDAAIRSALSETLPWRAAQSARPRHLPQQR